MVGYICPQDKEASYGAPTSTLSVHDNGGRAECPVCHARLQLEWDVHIVVVPPSGEHG